MHEQKLREAIEQDPEVMRHRASWYEARQEAIRLQVPGDTEAEAATWHTLTVAVEHVRERLSLDSA